MGEVFGGIEQENVHLLSTAVDRMQINELNKSKMTGPLYVLIEFKEI